MELGTATSSEQGGEGRALANTAAPQCHKVAGFVVRADPNGHCHWYCRADPGGIHATV